MFILSVLFIGFVVGWGVNRLSDYLPRFAASVPPTACAPTPRQSLPPGLLRLGSGLLSAGAFAMLWLRFGLAWDTLFYAGAYAFFLLVALIDVKYRLVLNVMTYPAIGIILFIQFFCQRMPMLHVFLGGGMAFAIFFVTAWLKPGDLGGGDIKLATLIGLLLGFPQVLWALIVGGGLGAGVAIFLWYRHRESKLTIAYAPFLCLGVMVALLYNPILLMR